MGPASFLSILATRFPVLIYASLGAALFAAIVALLARSRFAPPPRILAVLWWLVAAKAIVALLWSAPLPVLPAHPAAARAAAPFVQDGGGERTGEVASGRQGLVTDSGFDPAVDDTPATAASSTESAAKPRSLPTLLAGAAVGLWLLGALGALALAALQTLRLHGLLRRATAVADRALCARLERLAEQLGVTRAPHLKISSEIDSALVCGLGRGTILLPARRAPGGEDLDLVLAHELLHLRHRDLVWGLVPALAARLLFFHPLVRLAAREHILTVEAARDREVLACLEPEPERYGRLLVRWGVAPRVAMASATAASPTFTTLRRRLEMLEQRSRRFGAAGIAALAGALLLAVPIRPVAAWAGDAPSRDAAVAAPSATSSPTSVAATVKGDDLPPAPPAPPAPAAKSRPALAPPAPPAPPIPPAPPALAPEAGEDLAVPPVPPVPPVAPVPPVPPRAFIHLAGPLQSFALVSPDGTMSIQSGWFGRAPIERLKKEGRDVLWFRWKDQDYIVRDATTVAQVHELFRKQVELGAQQARLGADQARLSADHLARSVSAERSERAEKDLEARQQALARQQDELGAEQESLGREQEKASAAIEAQLHDLLERAIADGKAQKDE